MKLPLEILVAIVFWPLATLLVWRDLLLRRDLSTPLRAWWLLVSLLPGLGPILYLGIGRGRLWEDSQR